MIAVRAEYDGREIHIPDDLKGLPPCSVIVLFDQESPSDDAAWLKLQEQAFAKAWDDTEDAIYDQV